MKHNEPAQGRETPFAYRADIDGLRAIAILSVVAFHAFPSMLPGGFVGVDIFFVISGFLISSIIFRGLEKDKFSFGDFYVHRIRRIFPALIVVLTACFVFGWFSLLPEEYKQLGKHMAAGAGFIQNFVLWKESGYFDVESDMKPLLHLWSLSVEEQFYLLYPLLVWAIWRAKMSVRAMILLLMAASFALNLWWIQEDPVRTFYLPITRVWELLAGAVCALVALRAGGMPMPRLCADDARNRNVLSVLGLLLIVVAIAIIDRTRLFPGWWALLPVTGAALLVLSGPQAWVNRHLLANPVMVWVGLISYPLYLWHWPLLSFTHILTPTAPSPGARAAAVALSFLLAWLTYRLLERPIRFSNKSWLVPAALVLLLTINGFAGFNDFHRNGLSFRLPTNIKQEPVFAGNTDTICESADGAGLEFCRQSRAGKPTVFILGDSHAWHLFQGLASAAEATGDIVAIRAVGACMGFSGISSDTKRSDCAPAKARIASAAENDSVDTVVISARWDMYFKQLPQESFERAIRDTLTSLGQRRKHIVFVMDIPILDFHPKYCLDIHLPLRPNISAMGTCAVAQHTFEEQSGRYREVVMGILKDFPDVDVYDSAAKLCHDKLCWAMKDGELLYRDYDHLSQVGSDYIAKSLWPVIQHRPIGARPARPMRAASPVDEPAGRSAT
ncbi:acyltransferase [Herbaspirillum sp. LeCh32-8]|uniref:acyltransferase family protein n=1 Tax=Herbaspirillum sp. LeCh32-8 TaxID=2821356 RepID=UPI001AE6ACB0|nr:acyltransferase family protein [Herbaspirillum sp. LeCh32-8]MBP0600763.1 acyltransferase [Herbaspirillum sp. LeCh32-8]